MLHGHSLLELGAETVTVCSLLHTFLPPWEAFDEFPSLQKYYKLIIYIIGYVALNGRSTVYRGISTKDGAQLSPLQAPQATATPPSTGGQ